MTEDPYADFAQRYDLFYQAFDEQPQDRVEFFRRVFAENDVKKLLDCACGTGRDLALFHRLGLEVAGSDISEAMLAVARRNLAKVGADIPLRQADYCELDRHFGRQFDAVVSLSSALLEVPDEAQMLKALSSMRAVLAEGGIVIISQGTTDKMWKERPRFIPVVNRADFSRIFVIDYTESGARYNVLDLFHDGSRTEFKVWTREYRRILFKADYERLLLDAGFKAVEFYGSYAGTPYDERASDLLICEAHR